ncbi:MAG: thioredoxin family protein [Bacteroidia bacterium]|nr:thioredoxin family protein [Bacteroidia bacterium]MCZ2278293.1 thioredoxin family protein [Bacteroidia bacterium]
MTFQQYKAYFEKLLDKNAVNPSAPYDDPDYLEYTQLNWSRMNRWIKTGKLTDETKSALKAISQPQQWIVITEPWCGDAAHNVPFIELMSRENSLIRVSYELRDSEPFRIEQYLTNGTKSIPKLVIFDSENKEFASWGPRPEGCAAVYAEMKAQGTSPDSIKLEIQKWYNADKGISIQKEVTQLLQVIA